ncbi:hypothetical protein [Sphingosinicella sp. BN140058]|uniref:hypothetical protein n=1 Tax=Sphingosinicella sp. BN140058 TaxID=1892855 RepID=UPI0010134319|nr:hypothetical protein [Sphingosinicella sp. BN140058]QAY79209.1 hypothetical protein ETR14_23710 [Sphingosinicella sp. BN140058]
MAAMTAGSPFRPLPEQPAIDANASERSVGSDRGGAPTKEGIAKLPFAQGHVFATLDDYLAHLKRQSAIDLPWWREVSPGVYEHVRRMPEGERETATRAELLKRFGFSR